MLRNAPVTPIVHVADLDRARRFYSVVLGLQEQSVHAGAQDQPAFVTGNGVLELTVRPDAISREATAMSFAVPDVVREVKELSQRGARFEPVDLPGGRREGVVTEKDGLRCAWLKDSEGNWLCLHE